ncbi:MAG: SusC/RagA family TonB-linked outer membrane protein [Rubricoccaceae bacterium]
MRSLRHAALLLVLCASASAAAQTSYTLSGRVLDARQGAPLPGATVLVEGTGAGAAADLDGQVRFSATLAPGTYTLRVSFTGYRTERRPLVLGAAAVVSFGEVRLAEDVLRSDEVVVTGTGVPTERRQLGNTIGTVDARDLQAAAPRSVDQALAGKLPGVVVQQNSGAAAGGVSIRLRGTGTVLGSADPLYIVDGVIVDNSSPNLIDLGGGGQNRLVDLNPEDIERVEVVKGAAAAALYGSRANNGVVQIFTRRGQTGAPRVTLQSSVSQSALRKRLAVNRAPFSRPVGVAGRTEVQRFDYQDDIFRGALGTQQYLSVSGGTAETTYFVSGGYLLNQGIVRGNAFERVSARARVGQALSRALRLSVGGAYASSGGSEIPNGGLAANYGALTGFIFGPNTVDIRPDPVTGVYGRGLVLANPLEVVEVYDFRQRTNRFTGDVQASYVASPALRFDYTLGLDTYEQAATAFIPRGTTAPGFPAGFARRAELTSTLVNHDLRARYQTRLGAVASTTLIGGTVEQDRSASVAAQGTDIPVGVRTIAGVAVPAAPGETRAQRVVAGLFAQQTFGVAGRLFLTAAGRVDASSAFGAANRWNAYPKVSASYAVSDEAFWRGALAGILPTARLRASYGETGGLTAIGPFDRFNRYVPVTYNNLPGFYPATQQGQPDIRPERQREIEVGADLGLAGGRAGLEVTYYSQRTTDLLLNRSLAPTTGFSNQLQNIGVLTNRGLEVLLRAQPVATNTAAWTMTATFATNRNVVSGIEGQVLQFPDAFGGFTAAVNGRALGVFYGSTYRRDADGNLLGQAVDRSGPVPVPLVQNGQPVLVPATRTPGGFLVDASGNQVYFAPAGPAGVIGDPNPDWTGSFINELEFGRVAFRVQLDASVGGDVFNFTRRLAANPNFGTLADYQREIEGEVLPGHFQRLFGTFEHWIEDGSFVKLRELTLTYRVPGAALPPGVQGLRVSAYGRNLLSFDNYSGYDPEVNVGGQRTTVRGFDFVETPIPRTFGLSVSASL